MAGPGLDFELEIAELESRISVLQRQTERSDDSESELRTLRTDLAKRLREVYASLDAWQTVQVARHKNRPYTLDYLNLAFDDFVELHGDKHFGDDRAMLSGFAKLDRFKVMVIGHQKGRTFKERAACHFGCAHPEGYRKAMSKMRLAEKYKLPLICFIDTPGAYPGVGAEERGQAQVIAESMFKMSQLRTPIICVVIGEGGSGGALGIGVGDRIAVMQHAYYSVISPEGCAGILWKSHEHAPKAAAALRFTSDNLKRLGVVDDVLDEPLGGAHRNYDQMADSLKHNLIENIESLESVSIDKLLDQRYNKLMSFGQYREVV